MGAAASVGSTVAMVDRTAIRAVLFDADGVIQHATDDLALRVHAALGFVPSPLADFRAEVFAAELPALTGERDVVAALAPVLEKWGAPGKAADLVHSWWSSIDVDVHMVDLIHDLRARGYVCALATNQHEHRARHMDLERGYAELFDRAYYSCRLGLAKPDARYFDAIVNALALEPDQLLLIDDNELNVAGARAAGLQAVRFVHGRRPDAAAVLRGALLGMGLAIGESLPHGVVVVIRRSDGRYLFIRRSEQSTFAGHFCPVSGRVESGESYAQTAVREAREEVGIEVRPIRELHVAVSASGHFLLHWWLCEHLAGEPGVAAPDEVAEVVWVRACEVHELGPHFEVDVALMRELDASY